MKSILRIASLIIIITVIFTACDKKTDDGTLSQEEEIAMQANSCEGCHTNYEVLKAVYTPDPPSTGGAGCGGDVPHYEPYDRVYLGGAGYENFTSSIHGQIACTTCHNGTDNTSDKTVAHSGDFIKKPSHSAEEKCATCHPAIYEKSHNSLHTQGWGQKRMVVERGGYDNFNSIPEHLAEGYEANCAKCHASCGDCHVNRPIQGGGGLYAGHNFVKPDQRDHCTTCHVSRGGHAYYGVAIGTVPDVHLTKMGYKCVTCHSTDEIHGDGVKYDTRYQMALKPECTDCHSGVETANNYHSKHFDTFNCNVCHSQDYNNCGSCHVHGVGARIEAHQGFKIGMNPIPEIKPYKYALLRQSLSAPDTWSNYGVDQLATFDAHPTYKYTTPHNILKWTTRTEVEEGKACYDACHIIAEGDTLRNKELYLYEEDLLEWEKAADQGIIVDGKLPSYWKAN